MVGFVFFAEAQGLEAREGGRSMTGVGDTTDRAARWIRVIARVLALLWALLWTSISLTSSVFTSSLFIVPAPSPEQIFLRYFALHCFIALVSVAIAWRWDGIGGVALLLAGLLSFIVWPDSMGFGWLVAVRLPPFVAGALFLASWWRSRTA